MLQSLAPHQQENLNKAFHGEKFTAAATGCKDVDARSKQVNAAAGVAVFVDTVSGGSLRAVELLRAKVRGRHIQRAVDITG